MKRIEVLIDSRLSGKTVQHVALKAAHLSGSAFRSMKFSGGIKRNGKAVRANERVNEGDCITFTFEEKCRNDEVKCKWEQAAAECDYQIVYEDADLYVIDKGAPLPTMASARQSGHTLESALYSRFGGEEGYCFRPVNRLDKGTSGLMVVAKNAYVQQLLQKQLHTDTFIREYIAVCDGVFEHEAGAIELPIAKEENSIRRKIDPCGKKAVTHYRLLQQGKERSCVQLRLETGRTHQIRVHMAAIGCPVTGDYLYGMEHEKLKGRFALHSCFVSFLHPITGETIAMKSPMPPACQELLNE